MAELQMGMSGRLVTTSKSKGRLTTPGASFSWAGLAITGTVGIIYSFFLFFLVISGRFFFSFWYCFVLYVYPEVAYKL